MFCPHCGVKNDGSPIQCAACKKSIPPPDAGGRGAPVRARAEKPVAESAGRLASVGDRMLALAFDRAVIAALGLAALAALAPAMIRSPVAVALLVSTAVFLYHFLFEALFGTTLGKAVMGLQVRSDGERGRLAGVAIRNALRVVDGLVLYLVGFLTATFSQKRQRFGDIAGGTIIVEMPMSKGSRAAMMLLWLAMIVAGAWVVWVFWPGFPTRLPA